MEKTDNDWIPLSIFETKGLTMPAMRAIIFNREKNGAGHFLRKFSKKWWISPSRFYEWIDKEGKCK